MTTGAGITVYGSGFEMTLTAVALLLHSMENSIDLMGLRAVFSDWLHNNYQSNYGLFEARGSILGQVTMQEVRGTVCGRLELGVASIAVVLVCIEKLTGEWRDEVGGMNNRAYSICVNDAMDESKH